MSTDSRTSLEAEVFTRLAAPFDDSEVRTKPGRGRDGKPLRYITARTARRRLNEALGPAGWGCMVQATEIGVRCSITITLPDGRQLTREALGGYPDMPSAEDRAKGGDSDAFKRAAALFGVGEYLYGEEVYAGDAQQSRRATVPFKAPPTNLQPGERSPDGPRAGGTPRTGAQLYAFLRDSEKQYKRGPGLTRHILDWARSQGWPERLKDWDFDMIKAAQRRAGEYLRGKVSAHV